MDNKNLEFFLEEQLDRTGNWLKYAEAKNGVLLTLSLACVTKFDGYLKSDLRIGILLIFLGMISILVCMCSFFPNLNEKIICKKRMDIEHNLIFYRDISFLTADEYITKLTKRYGLKSSISNAYCKDLASEIIVNSTIAIRKNFLFKIAFIFLSVSVVIFLVYTCLMHIAII